MVPLNPHSFHICSLPAHPEKGTDGIVQQNLYPHAASHPLLPSPPGLAAALLGAAAALNLIQV